MYKLRRRLQLSQTFLRNQILVIELVQRSSIGSSDLILEIGPGKGIITQELLRVAKRVIAIELDGRFYRFLKRRFTETRNLALYHADGLRVRLPQIPYKVFANIPFSIEGKFVRKLIDDCNPPEDCYLVMRRSVAERLGGIYEDGLFSIIHKPWFTFEIFHRFQPRDFSPTTLVNPIMLRITKLQTPLVSSQDRPAYTAFVRQAFSGGRHLKQNLRPFFRPAILNQLAQKYHFSVDARPRDLTIHQWMALFRESQI